jgi:hypothetical protein
MVTKKMFIYRVIKTVGPVIVTDVFTTLMEAYQMCKLLDESNACRMMYNGVSERVDRGETLIRVTSKNSNPSENYWIEVIDAPLPALEANVCGCLKN